jgi:transposase InsO family protein
VLRAAGGDVEALRDIAAFVVQYGYPADLALRTLNTHREQQGLAPYEISVGTINRHLDRMGLSRRDADVDKRVHRRWEAPYAGHTYQMDATVAGSWWIDSGRTVSRETRLSDYKNKTVRGKTRIWLLVITDDHSRWTWARFVEGIDTTFWIHVLLEAMRPGSYAPPDVWPAHGVPERLYVDNDSAMKSAEFVQVCEGLGIELQRTSVPDEHFSSAQAKGKVERRAGVIMKGFEIVSHAARFTTLDQMNAALVEYLIRESRIERKHLGGQSPVSRWLATARVRELPTVDVTRALSLKRQECKIYSDVTIRLNGPVQLPRRAPFIDYIGKKVLVEYYRADPATLWVVIDRERHQVERIAPQPDVAGDYRAAPETAPVRAKKEALARDLSSYVESGAIHNVWAHENAKDTRTYPIRPGAEPHPLQNAAAVAPDMIPWIRATQRLQAEALFAVPLAPDQKAQLTTLFSGRREIPEPELQEFIRELRGEGTAVPERGRLRIVA